MLASVSVFYHSAVIAIVGAELFFRLEPQFTSRTFVREGVAMHLRFVSPQTFPVGEWHDASVTAEMLFVRLRVHFPANGNFEYDLKNKINLCKNNFPNN